MVRGRTCSCREVTNVEENKLLSIVRPGAGGVARWPRTQVVLWSAQGMDVPQIATTAVTRTGPEKMIQNFNADGFDSLARLCRWRTAKFTLPEHREIKKGAHSRPQRRGRIITQLSNPIREAFGP